MSHEHLLRVEASRALEATRRFEDLFFFHVPFDELNGDDQTESTLARLIASEGRVAVIGASGSGKSSVISWVLGPLSTALPDRLVPLRVPVAAEVAETVTEPGSMARHLVRYVTRWASRERFSQAEQEEFARGVAEVTRRAGGARTRQFHVGLPLWLANVEFARQVQAAGEDYELRGSAADAVEYLRRMVAIFDAHGLYPVLVFDDSDTWLSIPGMDRTELANAFFARTVRMLAKELDAALVVAVHEGYLGLPGYREGSQFLSGEIRIPRLIDASLGIDALLRDRLVMSDVDLGIEDVMDPDAVVQLAKHYESGKTIRDLLRVAQRSLQHALSDGVELVTAQLVEQAVTELTE